jgi:predicted O-methyltransferase YrrM
MPQFTENWFSGHVPHWERLFFGELEWKPDAPRRLVEIGCFEGRSTLWFLENLLRHPESRIVCIDTFNGGTEHTSAQTEGLFDRFNTNLTDSGQAHKAEVLRCASFEGLLQLITRGGEGPDLIYVDGSHEAPDVLADLVLAFRLVSPGGVILCDDYLWPHIDVLSSPKLAIDAFTNIYRRKIEFLDGPHRAQLAFSKLDHL